MAGSKAQYFERALLDHVFGGATWPTLPASLYLILSSAAYSNAATGSACNELSGGGYSRLAFTRNTTNFPASTGGGPSSITNGVALAWAAATGSQGTATSFYVADASTAGNILYGGDLTTAKAIGTGDTPSFAASNLTATED